MENSQRGTKLSVVFALLLLLGTSLFPKPSEAAPQDYYEQYFRDARAAPCPDCPADQPEFLAARSLSPIEQEYSPAQASHYVTRSVPPTYHHVPANAYEPPAAEPSYEAAAVSPPNPVQQAYYYQAPAPPSPAAAGQPAAAQQAYSQAPAQPPYETRQYSQAQRAQAAQHESPSYLNNRLQPPQPEAISYANNRLQPPQAPAQLNRPADPQQAHQVPDQLNSASNQRQPASRTDLPTYLNTADNRQPADEPELPPHPSSGHQRPAAPPSLPEARFYGNPNSRYQQPAVSTEARLHNSPGARQPPPPPPRYRYHQSSFYQPPSSFRSFNYNPYSVPEYQASMYAGYGRNELEEDEEELPYAKYPRSPDDALRIEQPAQPGYPAYEDRRNPYATFRQYSKDGSLYDNRSRGGDKLYVVYRADQSDSDLESVVRQAIDIARQQRAQDRYRYEQAYMLAANEEEEDAQPVIWTRQNQMGLNQATSNDRYDLSAGKVISSDGQYVLQSDQKDRTKWIAVPTKTLEDGAATSDKNLAKDDGELVVKKEPSEKREADKQMDFVEDMELPLSPTEPSNFDRPAETTTSA